MYTQIRIINIKSNLEKIINMFDYNETDLNIICNFYDYHKNYVIEMF